MLRLLAQREEGYEDIAALLGVGVDEVRSRVRDALTELDETDTEIAAAAEAKLAEEPAAPAPVAEPAPRPAPDPSPAADSPTPQPDPSAPTGREPAAAPVAPPPPAPPAPSGKRPLFAWIARNRRRVEIAGGALVVVLVVLFATGVVDLGGSDSGDDGDAPTVAANGGKAPTQAVLEAVGGGDAEGRAVFGRAQKQVMLIVAAEGLAPTAQGRSYAISLVRRPGDRIPIAAARANAKGELGTQVPVPTNVLGLIAGGYDSMEVTLVDDSALRQALRRASRKAPRFAGEDVLRGEITGPIVEAGQRERSE